MKKILFLGLISCLLFLISPVLGGAIIDPSNGFPISGVIDTDTIVAPGEYSVINLIVTGSSTLTLTSDPSAADFKGVIIHANNIRIDAGSRISADGTGYIVGPGTGTYSAGSGYGGEGGYGWGWGTSGVGGPTYGSALHPTDLGSGVLCSPIECSSRGGGAIRLMVADLLTIDGDISSNGSNIAGVGGSGGSIYITAGQLTGSGNIMADGATGYGPDGYGSGLGSGGGGRIAVYYGTSSFTGKTEVIGGLAKTLYQFGTTPAGEDGTIVFVDTNNNILYPGSSFRFQENDGPFSYSAIILDHSYPTTDGTITIATDTCTIKDGSILNLDTPGTVTFSADTLNVDTDSILILGGNVAPLISSTTSLMNNATITSVPEQKILLTTPTLSIDPTSRISVDGKGYADGPGTLSLSGGFYPGGGYGGMGGGGGPTYGSALEPTDFGSGVLCSPIECSTRGGGAIRLMVADLLTIDGDISSNGNNNAGAGGSGGSIYITAGQLTGSGSIMANGATGAGHDYYAKYGSGGGGRIAIDYETSTFTGTAEAKGAPYPTDPYGSPPWPGEDGTVVWRTANQPPVLDFVGDREVNSGQLLQFSISASDPDSQTLTYSAEGLPTGASFDTGTQTFSWTPTIEQVGTHQITFIVSDSTLTDSEQITITVHANTAPVATADSYSTNQGSQLVIAAPGVLTNDNDADGNTITAVKVTDPAHGTLTLNANGGFTYKPSGKYVGSDSFTYKAYDGFLYSASATVSITISKPTVVAPTAKFTATPNDLTVQFTDLSSGTAPLSYSWNFGDKKTSTAQNPTHTYSNAGSYTVTLTVKNSGGSSTTSNLITVTAPPKPTAAFHADVQTGPAPLTVIFTDDSSGTAPLTYSWNFGDKKTSTLQNPAHTYTKAGSYTVTLTVKNSGGSTTATNTIIVS